MPISFKVWSNEGFYKGIESNITSDTLPQIALNKPLSKEKILDQLSKTGSTEFEFENINIIMDDNLFIQMGILNDLRRTVLENLENLVLDKYKRNLNNNEITLPSVFDYKYN